MIYTNLYKRIAREVSEVLDSQHIAHRIEPDTMQNEIIKKTAEIIADINAGKKTIRVEASTCGHLVDEWLREYEENAEDDICKATEKELEEAFNDCVDYGCEEITPEELLRQIASKAECHDEHACIDRVNVWEVR